MALSAQQIREEIDSLSFAQIEAIARKLGEDPGEFFIRVVGGVDAANGARHDTGGG